MQQFLIYLGLLLGLFFWVWSYHTKNWGMYIISAIFFFLIAVGVLSTGWELFEGNFTITEVSSTVDSITPVVTTYNATLAENPTVWGFGLIMLVLSFSLSVLGIRTKNINAISEEYQA